jgi:hypothetical protein
MTKVLALALICLATLAGCEDRYRYVCQDPENWEKDICKKPQCEVTRSCPEHIFKEEKVECKK